jgi:transposase
MGYIKINPKTYIDNSGRSLNFPILLIDYGGETFQVFKQMHRYQVRNREKSISWHNKLCYITGLLLEYLEANEENYTDAKNFFENFADIIYSGTISDDAHDPSGLYWLPKSPENANQLLQILSEFSDWLSYYCGAEQLNPWRKATSFEERLNYMAVYNKREHMFLGHLHDYHEISRLAKQVRNVKRRKVPYSHRDIKEFPEEEVVNLLTEGFKRSRRKHKNIDLTYIEKYNWRDIALTMLMNFGGLRNSEPFHLWIQDVCFDPKDNKYAIVRVFHPSEGKVPEGLINKMTGKLARNRAEYLLGLGRGFRPRNQYAGNDKRFVGWKEPLLDNERQKYFQVQWFPREMGYEFTKVWLNYLRQRNLEKIPENHPFAFVSLAKGYKGEMLTYNAQRDSYKKAVEKIGLLFGKEYGTTAHGHRHAYAQRLRKALQKTNLTADIQIIIMQHALHHKSPESQKDYTGLSFDEITDMMNKANGFLNNENSSNVLKDSSINDFDLIYKEINQKWKTMFRGN